MRRYRFTAAVERRWATGMAVFAATALLALIAGCGGGDSTATTDSVPTGELSATELATAADDLCTSSNAVKLDAQPPDFGSDGPQVDEIKASAPFWAATAAEQQRLLDELTQLQPPADLQKKYDEFLQLQEKANVEFAQTLQKYAEAGDIKTFFSEAADAQTDLQDLAASAQGLGMTVCGASDVPQSSGTAAP